MTWLGDIDFEPQLLKDLRLEARKNEAEYTARVWKLNHEKHIDSDPKTVYNQITR